MELFLNAVVLVVGFLLLIKGADAFVDGASAVSRKLKIPSVIIGLTVVAFGTSLPEFAVSISAAIAGSNGIAAGNVVGSNIFNLLMVAGLSAVFVKLPISSGIIRNDMPFMMVITAAMLALFMDAGIFSGGEISLSHGDGVILLLMFSIFLVYTIRGALSSRAEAASGPEPEETTSALKCALLIVLGAAGIILGGNAVVDSASNLAKAFGMSETLIGLTIVSVGTSLPELVTSVVAAHKGENDISVGNVVGSNIFNICFVLGLSTAIHPIAISSDIIIDTAILLVISAATWIAAMKNRSLGRPAGIVMVLAYAAYLTYIIMRNYAII